MEFKELHRTLMTNFHCVPITINLNPKQFGGQNDHVIKREIGVTINVTIAQFFTVHPPNFFSGV